MIGRNLSHYEITGRLGAGGMGEVYLARDLNLGRSVAIKVLPAGLAADASRLKRLQREAKALAALDHPNIVTIHSVEEADGTHFLTMAFVEGKTLEELIPADGMPLAQLIDLAATLSDALSAAHERGIIHRDLKPANIMVGTDGRLRVLDFGLARVDEVEPVPTDQPTRQMDEPITRHGLVMGTIPYMSPEQAEGKLLDARSDLFSLGAVLYEMATGSRPFTGDTPASMISSILRDEPPAVSDARPQLPERFNALITRCLAKRPDARPQSAGEVRDELAAIRQELQSGVSSGGAGTSRRSVSSSAIWIGVVAIVIASIVGAIVWQHRFQTETTDLTSRKASPTASRRIGSIAVLPLRNLSGDTEQEYLADGMTEALITDLSRIGAIRVISRTSAMRYKGSDKALADIAGDLGVDAILEGSVVREGGRVRVTAQLIHAGTDGHLWADRYERDLSSVMALQGEIARTIAREIEATLTPDEESRLTSERRIDPAAYDAYLKGIFHRNQFTPQDLATALDYFSIALEREPDFAAAYVGAASIWAYRMVLGLVPQAEACRNWKVAIAAGLSRDDLISEAHVGLAQIRMVCDWDWSAAEEAYRRALEVNPGNAEAHMFYANFLGSQHRHDEAEREVRRALELDPMNGFYRAAYGVQLSFQERFDEAIDQFQRSFAISPGGGFAHGPYARALFRVGRTAEAAAEMETHLSMLGERDAARAMREGAAVGGYSTGALRAATVLADGSHLADSRPTILVYLFDDAGDQDQAIRWLERAFQVRDLDMAYLSVVHVSAELRSDPAFVELLERLELPIRE